MKSGNSLITCRLSAAEPDLKEDTPGDTGSALDQTIKQTYYIVISAEYGGEVCGRGLQDRKGQAEESPGFTGQDAG